jgi:hypothetical protein
MTTYQTLLNSKMYDHVYFVVVGKKGEIYGHFFTKKKVLSPFVAKIRQTLQLFVRIPLVEILKVRIS